MFNFLKLFTKKEIYEIVEESTSAAEIILPPPMQYPIFLNSMPKSGTHLLSKAVMGIPNIVHSGYHFERKALAQFVDEGVDYPVEGREDMRIPNDLPWMERLLQAIPPGQYITAHMYYSQQLHNLLQSMNFKIIMMLRDPRDVVLSWADFMEKEKTHLLFPFLSQKDLDFRIKVGIKGIAKEITGSRRQPPISELLRGYFNWATQAGPFSVKVEEMGHFQWVIQRGVFLVKFEDLIGEKGGGSKENQKTLLKNLIEFFEIEHDEKVIESICEGLFGDTHTFNKGVIGRWRNVFTEEHKSLFKEEAGKYLIDLGYEENLDW